MTFQEILPEFLKGSKIRRNDWSKDVYIYIDDCSDILNHSNLFYRIDGIDLSSSDWELYTEKCFDWNKAYELMKDGKKVRRKKWNKLDTESIFIKDNFFLKKYDELYGFYTVHDLTPKDLEAKDWYLVED